MKVLIIDDEKLTREGIISTVNWDMLGIHEILEADDGINAIALAKLHKPNIILSDIRMPRMNGIEMYKEIYALYPKTSIIFMSGYSDKEYLKAAITLKAISYVEKPIDTKEIELAIKNAVDIQNTNLKNQISLHSMNKYNQSKLGLKLIYSSSEVDHQVHTQELNSLGYQIKPTTEFTTLIITLKTNLSILPDQFLNELYATIETTILNYSYEYILSIKNDQFIILHLFRNDRTKEKKLITICNTLSNYLKRYYGHYIAVGKTVIGIKHVFESYNIAVSLLQSSFFYDYNSIITSSSNTMPSFISQSYIVKFTEVVINKNYEGTLITSKELYQLLKNNQHILPNYAKDIYYRLFTILFKTAASFHIIPFQDENSSTILDFISKDNNLTELHNMLLSKIEQFFNSLLNKSKDNATIYAIKEFIGNHYGNETLSVKDISESVYLSSSYVCTLFKNETGKTLNQYLTEYRVEKAKNLLKDSRHKITDISSKVGYSDGNYFGKTFKKLVGLSPSEYREHFK